MDFALLPPEVNSGLMYTGPGAGPMLAAAAGWQAVAAELESAASGYSSQVSGLTAQAWSGPSAMLMANAAAPYVAWLQASAGQAGQTAAQAYTAAAAYEAAFAATVPPPVIAANRAQLATLVATNFFGQNTPAIAATEAHYAAMWAQDATAMYGYAAAAQPASTLTPFNQPPQTTNPAGQLAQAHALTQATTNTTAAHTQSLVQATTQSYPQGVIVDQGGTYNVSGAISVTNGGTVHITSTGVLNIANGGTLNVNGGTLTIDGTVTISPGGLLNIQPGGGIGIFQGTTLAIGHSSTLTVAQSGGISLYNGSIAVQSGSSLMLNGSRILMEGGSNVLTVSSGSTLNLDTATMFIAGDGHVAIGSGSTVTLHATPGATLLASGGSVNVNGSVVTVGPGGHLGAGSGGVLTIDGGAVSQSGRTEVIQPVTITAATTPSSPAGLMAASTVGSSPGLAGTSGIQPQLNVEGLLHWASTLPGADLAADITPATGLG